MAVSMKNVDFAFHGVGQKPYPTITCMFFFGISLLESNSKLYSELSVVRILYTFLRVSLVGIVTYVRHWSRSNCFP